MKQKLAGIVLLTLISVAVVLFPSPNNYRSPLMWAQYGTGDDRPVDVFIVSATSDLGKDGTFQSSTFLPEDRYYQKALLHYQELFYQDSCRLYAPYYRQACLSIYYLDEAEREPYLSAAYREVREAFLWYLDHENQGRPFILAGFSQGAELGLWLLEEFFDDPQLQSQLVAAYIPGWRITPEDLEKYPHLKMAQGETDTGVIISFNSEADFVTDSIILPEGEYTYGINPLNWRTDDTLAPRELNLGACYLHMDGTISHEDPAVTGCYRDPERGMLVAVDLDPADYPPGEPVFVEGCYHNFDLQLYSRNVQENVARRVEAYLEQNG